MDFGLRLGWSEDDAEASTLGHGRTPHFQVMFLPLRRPFPRDYTSKNEFQTHFHLGTSILGCHADIEGE